jgi:hypothetical protein
VVKAWIAFRSRHTRRPASPAAIVDVVAAHDPIATDSTYDAPATRGTQKNSPLATAAAPPVSTTELFVDAAAEPPSDHPTASHHQPDEAYVRGVIEFLDKRWTHAEKDLAGARRSMLLWSSLVAGLSVLMFSAAVAAATLVRAVGSTRELAGYAGCWMAGFLAAAGAGLAAARRRRLLRPRGDPQRQHPAGTPHG